MQDWEVQYKKLLRELEENPPLRTLQSDNPDIGVWYKLQMENCICAGGTQYCMYLKKGSSNNLIVFMIGGGLSWNQKTAKCGGSLRNTFNGVQSFYTDEVQPNNDYWFFCMPQNRGLFSLEKENRFADWSIAMVNYGTGDIHIGQNEYRYVDVDGQEKILHHHGYANFRACLDKVKQMFPSPDKLLIAGESAGGFAVPAVAEDIINAYSDCSNITVYSDSALMIKEDWAEIVNTVWKAPERIAEGVHSSNIVADLFDQLVSRVGPKAKYLFSCGAGDGILTMFQSYFATEKFEFTPEKSAAFCGDLAEHVQALKGLAVPFGCYIHDFVQDGMPQHCTLAASTFHTTAMDGITPMDWLWKAVNGEVTDVGLQLLSKNEHA